MNDKKILNLENINNLLLALLICIPMVSFIFKIDNIIPITNMVVLVMLILLNLKKLKEMKIDIFTLSYLIIFVIMILINIICFGMADYVKERIMHFMLFGILPCMSFKVVQTANKKINVEKFIKFVIYIFAILSVFLISEDFWKYTPGRRMSISYYVLPLFIAIVIQVMFLDKQRKIQHKVLKYLLYVIIFYPYINFYLVFASRGALIAIMACVLICFIATRKTKDKKVVYTIIGFLIISFLLIYMVEILSAFNDTLKSFNIYSATIERTVSLLEEDNVGNGRDDLYMYASEEIQENLLIGNGIGKFYDEHGTYPHNIMLQLWHEGGIFFLVFVMIPIVYSVYLMIFDTKISDEKRYLLIFLFSICMIRLMISYEFWKDNYFFVYLYMIFMSQIEKRSVKNGNSNNSNI